MELTPELITAGIVGFLTVMAGAGAYLRGRRLAPKSDAVVAGVGLGYIEREQMERLIHEVKRVADAITDKNAADINDKLEGLAERLDQINGKRR